MYLKWLGYGDDYDSVGQSAPSKTLPADRPVFEEKKSGEITCKTCFLKTSNGGYMRSYRFLKFNGFQESSR